MNIKTRNQAIRYLIEIGEVIDVDNQTIDPTLTFKDGYKEVIFSRRDRERLITYAKNIYSEKQWENMKSWLNKLKKIEYVKIAMGSGIKKIRRSR